MFIDAPREELPNSEVVGCDNAYKLSGELPKSFDRDREPNRITQSPGLMAWNNGSFPGGTFHSFGVRESVSQCVSINIPSLRDWAAAPHSSLRFEV
jgi:hypothetical protein